MAKPLFKPHPTAPAGDNHRSFVRTAGIVVCILFSIVLPFCVFDEFHRLSFPNGSGNSVFTNAIRFYSGDDLAVPDPDRYIAIVTYIGLPDSDMEATKSSVGEIIRERVMPAFEKKGLRFQFETNEITDIRLYYKRDYNFVSTTDVKVFCFVTSKAAFALVVV